MTAKRKKMLLVAVGAVLAFVLYKRRQASGSSQAASTEVPFTPSSYFYADPFGGSGSGSFGGGTASPPGPGSTPGTSFGGNPPGGNPVGNPIGQPVRPPTVHHPSTPGGSFAPPPPSGQFSK